MKDDQGPVVHPMDVLDWPLDDGNYQDMSVITCARERVQLRGVHRVKLHVTCDHEFTWPVTPRDLLRQIALHAPECKGVKK